MKDLVKTTKFYKGAVHATILRPLTLDDVDVKVTRTYAKDGEYDWEAREATVSVHLAMREDDLVSLADALGVGYREEDGKRHITHDAMGRLANTWELTPYYFRASRSVETGYNRKRTPERKAQSIVDANKKIDAVDVELLKNAALEGMNDALESLVNSRNRDCRHSVERLISEISVTDDWLEQAIDECDEIDTAYYKATVAAIEELDRQRRELVEKIGEGRKVVKAAKRKVIVDSLLADAEGHEDAAEMVSSIRPTEQPDLTYGFN